MIISSEELLDYLDSPAPLTEGTDIAEHPAPGTPVAGYRVYKVYENDKLGSPNQHFVVDKSEVQVDPIGRGFYYWQNEETARAYLYQTIPYTDLAPTNLLGIGVFRIEGNATEHPFRLPADNLNVGFTADEVKVDPEPILFLSKQEMKEILNQIKQIYT